LHALPALNTDGDPATDDIDETRVGFVGHSLGGMVGTVFSASIPATLPTGSATLRTIALSGPGGGVAELLRDSPSFSPRINAGLGAQGLVPGTSLYAQYFRDTQTVVDAGDPLNYAAAARAARPIYLAQMVGGGGTPVAAVDQVIPNSATTRLIAAITSGGLSFPRVPAASALAGSGYVNFIQGEHGALLSPVAYPAATVEMQTEVVTFTLAPAFIQTGSPTVVQP
jgi:pimeloyl-ACP methyl ester carboxylesterase